MASTMAPQSIEFSSGSGRHEVTQRGRATHSEEELAATRIQSIVRGHLARNEHADMIIYDVSPPASAPTTPAASPRGSGMPSPFASGARSTASGRPPGGVRPVGNWPAPLHGDHQWGPLEVGHELLLRLQQTRELRVYACTWNMHGKAPPDDLRALLPQERYHVCAFGTEECSRSISASAFRPSKQQWEDRLIEEMGTGYRVLAAHALQAIHLIVFVHKDIRPIVSDVMLDAVACGVGQTLGNKGAVAIGCTVGKTSLLFVNCHFAAHHDKVLQRDADWARIETASGLTPTDVDHEDWASTSSFVSDRFDRVVWMGDVNYRIDGSRRTVDALLEEANHRELLSRDQLRQQMRRGCVFHGFGEAPLLFRPTYKLDAGSSTYDSSAKQRVPGWTDRILVKPPTPHMRVLAYRSLERVQTSDHRPVMAAIGVRLRGTASRLADRRDAGSATWPMLVQAGLEMHAQVIVEPPVAEREEQGEEDEDEIVPQQERRDSGTLGATKRTSSMAEMSPGVPNGPTPSERDGAGDDAHGEVSYERRDPFVFVEMTDGSVALVSEESWMQLEASRGDENVVRVIDRGSILPEGRGAPPPQRRRGRASAMGTTHSSVCTVQ